MNENFESIDLSIFCNYAITGSKQVHKLYLISSSKSFTDVFIRCEMSIQILATDTSLQFLFHWVIRPDKSRQRLLTS